MKQLNISQIEHLKWVDERHSKLWLSLYHAISLNFDGWVNHINHSAKIFVEVLDNLQITIFGIWASAYHSEATWE